MWARPFKHSELYEKKSPAVAPIYFAGVGYKYTNSIRGELDLQYGETRYKFGATTNDVRRTIAQRIRTTALVLNGYYEINFSSIVPYLTAGIGVGHNKAGKLIETIIIPGEETDVTNNPGKDKTNFIWNAGVGVKFDVIKNLALDVGYRWAHFGKVSTYSIDAAMKRTQKLRAHQVVGALIYNF